MTPLDIPAVLELKTVDEGCAIQQDAEVILLVNEKPTIRVVAFITKAQGADGGWYNVIKFRAPERVQS